MSRSPKLREISLTVLLGCAMALTLCWLRSDYIACSFSADFRLIPWLCQMKYGRPGYFKGLLKTLLTRVPEKCPPRSRALASWPFPAAPFPMITGKRGGFRGQGPGSRARRVCVFILDP